MKIARLAMATFVAGFAFLVVNILFLVLSIVRGFALTWTGAWLVADHGRDAAAAASATKAITAFPAWKSVSDPRLVG
jgi:hypothetical protein